MNKGTTFRGLALLGLLTLFAASPALLFPSPAAAYGVIETETFYSDATYTTRVGRCIENSCLGTYGCTGTITDYSITTIRGCAGGGV
jgi:hypothetical protein